MKKRFYVLLSGALALFSLAALFFGLYHARDAIRAKDALENGYTRRLMESSENLGAISAKLGKVPAAGETHTLILLLSGAETQAESLVSSLSALPLSHAAMADAIVFCNQLSEYTGLMLDKLAGGGTLTAEERQTLQNLCSQCRLLEGQFALARNAMLRDSLRLYGQENVYYREAAADARPLEAAGSMEYPSMVYDGAFSDARYTGTPKALGPEMISPEEAEAFAAEFIGASRVAKAEHGADVSGQLACYGVTLTLHDGLVINAAVTKQGGQMLWMMPEHAEFSPSLTLEECRLSAEHFLAAQGYGPVEISHYQVYDGMAVLNFAALQDGVILYPDLVKVQLRMDTGEVVGLESNNYLMNHTRREGLEPVYSRMQVLRQVSPLLTEPTARLCLIPYLGGERLCYEVSGTYGEEAYRIYVDAATGEELEILMMVQDPEGSLSV